MKKKQEINTLGECNSGVSKLGLGFSFMHFFSNVTEVKPEIPLIISILRLECDTQQQQQSAKKSLMQFFSDVVLSRNKPTTVHPGYFNVTPFLQCCVSFVCNITTFINLSLDSRPIKSILQNSDCFLCSGNPIKLQNPTVLGQVSPASTLGRTLAGFAIDLELDYGSHCCQIKDANGETCQLDTILSAFRSFFWRSYCSTILF